MSAWAGDATRRPVALLFPGQGAEEPRMGLALAAAFAGARELLELAAEETRADVPALLARGGRQLERTEVLQPVLVAVALGAMRALRAAGFAPDLVAGHSLGEVAAWSASGAVGEEDAVRLAAARGRLMAREAARRPGGMVALPDSPRDEVEAAVAAGRAHGAIEIAARNAPREWALSGDEPALAAVLRLFPARRLPVAGAWHSEAMRGAVEPLANAARPLARRPARARLVSGATGAPVELEERVPDLLGEQLVGPVRWADVMQTLARGGASDFVVAGPARVLRGLARKNLGPGIRIHVVSGPDDMARTAEALAT